MGELLEHLGRRLLVGFSARKNFLDLAKADESNPALRPLYGLRTFAIVMIVVGHRFGTFASGPVLNYDSIEEVIKISYSNINRIKAAYSKNIYR